MTHDMQSSFALGNRVIHAEFGPATVQFLGAEYVGLVFDDGHETLMKYPDGALSSWSAAAEANWQAVRQAEAQARAEAPAEAWPESTFHFESDEATHYLGSHWDAFHEQGAEVLLADLPRYLQEACLPDPSPTPAQPRHPLPAHWPQAVTLFWPGPERGLALPVRINGTAKQLDMASIYPYCGDAGEFDLEIDRVHVWHGGVEAQIEAHLGKAHLCFFDTHFVHTRSEYEHGHTLRFSLAGLAYHAEPSSVFELPYEPNPEQVAWEAQRAQAHGETYEPPTCIRLDGMAMFIPVDEWDRDDYSFRGPVKAVEPFIGFLGQTGWKVRVTIMRDVDAESDDIDLDIFVTRLAWQGESPPQVGQDIEGTLWLQGKTTQPAA